MASLTDTGIKYSQRQEKLTALSGNGARSDFAPNELAGMLELIEAFAQSAMPSSPVEYSLSDRKRLVDDLAARLKSAT